jgi:hypothetical protein
MEKTIAELPLKKAKENILKTKFFAKLKEAQVWISDGGITQKNFNAPILNVLIAGTTGPHQCRYGASYFRLKPQKFIDTYFLLDEENDYVLKGIYMYILGTDHCSI